MLVAPKYMDKWSRMRRMAVDAGVRFLSGAGARRWGWPSMCPFAVLSTLYQNATYFFSYRNGHFLTIFVAEFNTSLNVFDLLLQSAFVFISIKWSNSVRWAWLCIIIIYSYKRYTTIYTSCILTGMWNFINLCL